MSNKDPQETDVQVGVMVRLRRKELGLSQSALGEKVGITFQQVQKYEKGTNRIGASRLKDIARVLGVPISYFFPDTDGFPNAVDGISMIAAPDAAAMLAAFSRIGDRKARLALIEIARALAEESLPATAGLSGAAGSKPARARTQAGRAAPAK